MGALGSGKTLLLVINAFLSYMTHIFTNFTILLDNCEKYNLSQLFEVEKGYLYIDEAYMLAEARTSLSLLNRFISYVIFQSRKRELIIFLTAQLRGTLDVRLRDMGDITIYCKELKNGFLYSFIKNNRFLKTIFLPYEKASYFFQFYNTNERISPHNYQNLQYALGDMTTNLDLAEDLAKSYLLTNKIVTHDLVRLFLKRKLNEKPPKELCQDVYLFAKGMQKHKKKSKR